MKYQTKLSILLIFCAAVAVILPFWLDIGWEALIIIPIVCYLTKGLGSEVGAHRLWSHRSFQTSRGIEKLLIVLDTLAVEGSIVAFVGVHRLHHMHSDNDGDPHDPRGGVFAATFYQHKTDKFTVKLIKDMFADSWLVFQHKYYFTIQILIMLLLAAISPLILWYYCVNAFATVWINFLVNVVCHTWGTNLHNLQNNSKNNKWADIFLIGVGQHNTHHKNPGQTTLCWYDIWGHFINFVKIS